jgi:hypothetical protein
VFGLAGMMVCKAEAFHPVGLSEAESFPDPVVRRHLYCAIKEKCSYFLLMYHAQRF